MIASISGKVVERETAALVVEAGGVGYRVAVLSGVREKAKKGEMVTLKIYHQVTSDAQALYGFVTKEDLTYFRLLLTVPSVGPRTAMGILESAPPRVLEQAVAQEDITVLTKVSGVGRKTAERILVELKGKIDVKAAKGTIGRLQHDVVEALTSIGYTAEQAREAARKIPKSVKTVEEAVKVALQSQGVRA